MEETLLHAVNPLNWPDMFRAAGLLTLAMWGALLLSLGVMTGRLEERRGSEFFAMLAELTLIALVILTAARLGIWVYRITSSA